MSWLKNVKIGCQLGLAWSSGIVKPGLTGLCRGGAAAAACMAWLERRLHALGPDDGSGRRPGKESHQLPRRARAHFDADTRARYVGARLRIEFALFDPPIDGRRPADRTSNGSPAAARLW